MKQIRFPLIDPQTLFKIKSSQYYGVYLTEEQYLEAMEFNLEPELFKTNTDIQFKSRSTLFGKTTLLNSRLGLILLQWVPKTDKKKWILCYSGLKNGFISTAFHKAADNKGPSLVIIQSSNGNIFGGYNPQPWSSSAGYNNDNTSFLFTLVNKEGMPPTKFSKLSGKNGCYSNSGNGPVFGEGYDLFISSNSNKNTNSYTNLGLSYSTTIQDKTLKQKLLPGSYYFTVKEIEVFILEQ